MKLTNKEKRAVFTQLYCSCVAASKVMKYSWNDFPNDVWRMYDNLVTALETRIGFESVLMTTSCRHRRLLHRYRLLHRHRARPTKYCENKKEGSKRVLFFCECSQRALAPLAGTDAQHLYMNLYVHYIVRETSGTAKLSSSQHL